MFAMSAGSLRADGIEDGRDVRHEFFERRQRRGRDRIGEPGAALVEHDQAAERRQSLAEVRERRHVPLGVHVAEPLVEQQDVGRPLAEHLVREVKLAQSGISGLGKHRQEPRPRLVR